MKALKVTLVKSPIGYTRDQRDTVKSLGLTRLNKSRQHKDTPVIRGMLNKVSHLVRVEEVEPEE